MKLFPTISIVTCSYNCDLKIFKKSLEAIREQDYPKENIEHIVMDGGSTNDTVGMAKKYGCRVYYRPDLLDLAQVRMSLGLKKAKNDLILILEPDNIIVGRSWLKKMVKPYEDKNIFCTFSAYSKYEKNMPITTRYAALFGSPEPTLYYLKKTEKLRMDQKQYDKGQLLLENNNHFVVRFNQHNLPTLGDNGHMVRRIAIQKVNKNPDTYTHTDAFSEMLTMGCDTVGVVKNAIIHVSNDSVLKVVKQRIHIKQNFYDKRRGKRKYLVYNPKSQQDRTNLIKFILFSITFIIPLIDSLRGYIKIRDSAWFLHPIFCFLIVVGYGISEVKFAFKKIE